MNIALERLIEGMIATLRNDIIPHVADPYARGQAVGIIDLFNNIAPRLEWARRPVIEGVAARAALLRSMGDLAPDGRTDWPEPDLSATTAELMAERDRLDGIIGDLIARLTPPGDNAAAVEALAAIRRHIHDEAVAEMKLTRKPLFAEIASGGDGKKTGS